MQEEKQNGQGGELQAALDSLPALMAALTREYIQKRDVTLRIPILQRMKALLDFCAVDNEFPPNPSLEKDVHALGADRARTAALGDSMQMPCAPAEQRQERLGRPAPPPPAVPDTSIVLR